jgi:hypothetical protein
MLLDALHGLVRVGHSMIACDTAFLNGELEEEEVYLEQPELYSDGSDKVLKLNKALYGLKQAPRQWYKTLLCTMKAVGFTFCEVDAAVAKIIFKGKTAWVLFYVDDVLLAAKELTTVSGVKSLLLKSFDGKDKGEVNDFLGLAIHRDRSKRLLYIDQSAYARKIVSDAGMLQSRPKRVPLQPNMHKAPLGDKLEDKDAIRYRHLVGALLWLANLSRPDLAYAAGHLAYHLQVPTSAHQTFLKDTLAYLNDTSGHVLTLGCQTDDLLLGYVDSDYAQETRAQRKSVFGYIFQSQGSTISWKSKRQPTVARSSVEAEMMAAGQAV